MVDAEISDRSNLDPLHCRMVYVDPSDIMMYTNKWPSDLSPVYQRLHQLVSDDGSACTPGIL